ncbi:MAG TPA: glycosyltransferase family 39 protein [Acidobacteriaceae bacterium]|nr:glycosyltransferase family 39 protein [Acidobacteriaceae bacterium]
MPQGVASPPETSQTAGVVAQDVAHPRSGSDRLVLPLLCAAVFLLGCIRGAAKPFWFDEVATAHIAGASTWHDTLERSRLVDLHPPLEPLLVRLSFHLFGPHEFAGHLPSVVFLTIGVGALFVFLRRRTNAAYALFGALLPLCNADVFSYVTEARSYGLLFGSVCLAVAAYDTVLRGQRPAIARITLALALTATLQAHLFGTFAAGAFVLAEVIRSVRLRRIDILTWASILLPWISCLTYIPLLRIQAAGHGSPMVYEEINRTSLKKGLLFFHGTIYLPIAPLIKVAAVVLLCVRYFPTRRFTHSFQLPAELMGALLVLLAAPVLVTLLLHVRAPGSGFFPRYGIAAVPPAFLLLTGLISWRAGPDRRVAFLFLAAVLIGCAVSLAELPGDLRTVAHNGLFAAPPGLDRTGGVDHLCPDLPLAVNDPLEFLEADFRLRPDTETRMVYPTDPAESLRLEHENATQAVNGMARAFQTSHHVVPAAPFLAAHPDFLLLYRPHHTGWFADKLLEEHARILPLGGYKFAGTNADLWLVTQPGAGPFPAGPNCPAH